MTWQRLSVALVISATLVVLALTLVPRIAPPAARPPEQSSRAVPVTLAPSPLDPVPLDKVEPSDISASRSWVELLDRNDICAIEVTSWDPDLNGVITGFKRIAFFHVTHTENGWPSSTGHVAEPTVVGILTTTERLEHPPLPPGSYVILHQRAPVRRDSFLFRAADDRIVACVDAEQVIEVERQPANLRYGRAGQQELGGLVPHPERELDVATWEFSICSSRFRLRVYLAPDTFPPEPGR